MKVLKMLKIGDVIVLIIAFAIVIVIIAILPKAILLEEKRSMSVLIDHEITTIDFNVTDSEIYEIPIQRGIAKFEVDKGRVRMLPMNVKICPNQICSESSWIETSTQSIICLPNLIVVTIVNPIKPIIDGIAY